MPIEIVTTNEDRAAALAVLEYRLAESEALHRQYGPARLAIAPVLGKPPELGKKPVVGEFADPLLDKIFGKEHA